MNLSSQLQNLDIRKYKFGDGRTFESVVRGAAQELYNCIYREILEYYTSYDPNTYDRQRHSVPWKGSKTYSFERAMRLMDGIEVGVDNRSLSMYIRFDDTHAYHESVVWNAQTQSYGQDGYLPLLLNYGWEWSGVNKHIEHFTYYSGAHFIERGIKNFNKSPYAKYGITINISAIGEGQDGSKYTYYG